MATTGIVEGHNVGMYIGGVLIAAAKSKNLDRGMGLRDANNSDSGDSDTKLPGRKNWSVSGSGHLEYDAAFGINDLIEAFNNRTLITVAIDTTESGDPKETGSGYITQLKETYPDHDNSTYDWTITGSGDLVRTANS